MATVAAVIEPVDGSIPGLAYKITWANMANGDVGAPVGCAEYADRSVEVEGTFGTGGNVQMHGSNSGNGYKALTYDNTNVINITALDLKSIAEPTVSISPHVTAGDGATLLTVTMFVRR